jgi:dienelactone hydrolase
MRSFLRMVSLAGNRRRWVLGLALSLQYGKAQTAVPPAISAQPPITISIGSQAQPQLTVSISNQSQSQSAHAQYTYRSLRIATPLAGRKGLDALLISPPGSGVRPLAIINHGTPRKPDQRATMDPSNMLPVAVEFARRGWITVILMRRGYGSSGGEFAESTGECSRPDYFHSSFEAESDIRSAITYLSKLGEVDSRRILLVGVSSGGLATVALTADSPPGIAAAINFAGGNGSRADNEVCRPESLVDAFGAYGKKSRIPMLWVYSENDHYFSPELAARFYEAFTKSGGHAELRRAPAFQEDGHYLFSFEGIPIWTRYVDDFLKNQNLMLRGDILPPPPLPNVPPPPELSSAWRGAFSYYLAAPTIKAFAVSGDGFFGYRFGESTAEQAKKKAIDNCNQRTAKHDCRLVFLNNSPIK